MSVARLIEQRQARPPRIHELELGTHVIGRLAADVVVDHVDVSRRHAELEISEDGATIRDLASKNGVAVDGRRVGEAALDDGAQISLGDCVLVLDHPGARIERVLQRGGELTVRRPRPAEPEPPATARVRPLAPALAALLFALLLTLLLVYG